MDFFDEIYYSLVGQLMPEAALKWVPNLFAEGMPCDLVWTQVHEAEMRLLDRLGMDEDPEIQTILGGMEEIQYLLCRQVMSLRQMERDTM